MPLINPKSTAAQLSRTDWQVLAGLIAIQTVLSFVVTLENAFAVAISLGVLVFVCQVKWGSRRDPRMWVVIGIVAAVQVSASLLVHIPRFTTGLVFLPVMVLEAIALVALLNWIERRFPLPSVPSLDSPSSPDRA